MKILRNILSLKKDDSPEKGSRTLTIFLIKKENERTRQKLL